MSSIVPDVGDVMEARLRLKDWLVATPTLESAVINERAGTRVLVKAECLQHGGSFKIRGALNRLLLLGHGERSAGVVAYSSGNHGHAVALAAQWLAVPATIVMPRDAPETKQHSVRRLGAEVVLFDRYSDDREQIAAAVADERGAALVPPFDHPDVVAGQGTLGFELAAAAQARNLELSAALIPCGGGGLIAGCSLALKTVFPNCEIHAVEPEGYDDTARSLAAGSRQKLDSMPPTLCDGLMAATPGAISFAINKDLLSGALAVRDEEVLDAIALAARHLKLVVEPSGAVALAAALRGTHGRRSCTAVVVSGGNVDASVLVRALSADPDVGPTAPGETRGPTADP